MRKIENNKERNLHSWLKTTKNMGLKTERNLPALFTLTHNPFLQYSPLCLQPHIYGSTFPPLSIFLLSIYLPSLHLLTEASSFTYPCAAKRKTIVVSIKSEDSCLLCVFISPPPSTTALWSSGALLLYLLVYKSLIRNPRMAQKWVDCRPHFKY